MRKFTKTLAALLALSLLACPAGNGQITGFTVSASTSEDLSSLSEEDLGLLREQIDEELAVREAAPRPGLTRGDKGEDVTLLQLRLQELGYYQTKITGKYDNETQKAMKQFEKKNGLKNDGDASSEDQSLLFSNDAIPKDSTAGDPAEPKAETEPSPQNEPEADPETEPSPQSQPGADPDSEYEPLDYWSVQADPDSYIGAHVIVEGTVLQTIPDDSVGLRVRIGTEGYFCPVMVTVSFEPSFEMQKGDTVSFHAIASGTKTYTTVLGDEMTIPAFVAEDAARL